MKLIQQLNENTAGKEYIPEDAASGAVGAGAIAINAMPMFSTFVKRAVPKSPRIIKYSSGEVANRFTKKSKKDAWK